MGINHDGKKNPVIMAFKAKGKHLYILNKQKLDKSFRFAILFVVQPMGATGWGLSFEWFEATEVHPEKPRSGLWLRNLLTNQPLFFLTWTLYWVFQWFPSVFVSSMFIRSIYTYLHPIVFLVLESTFHVPYYYAMTPYFCWKDRGKKKKNSAGRISS